MIRIPSRYLRENDYNKKNWLHLCLQRGPKCWPILFAQVCTFSFISNKNLFQMLG